MPAPQHQDSFSSVSASTGLTASRSVMALVAMAVRIVLAAVRLIMEFPSHREDRLVKADEQQSDTYYTCRPAVWHPCGYWWRP